MLSFLGKNTRVIQWYFSVMRWNTYLQYANYLVSLYIPTLC